MYYIKLFGTLLKLNIQQELAYRTDAIVNLLVMLMWTGWELASLAIIFSNAQTLGGWTLGHLITLLGVFRLIAGLMFAIVFPNTEKFNQGMRDGSLDYTLLQPAPSLFLITFTRVIVWRAADLLLSAALVIIGLNMSGEGVTLASVASFALLLAGGLAIFYSLWIVMMAFTFWFIKFDNNVTILHALLEAGRYPATVYPAWLRVIITFVVPVALTTTVPVQALRGELVPWQVAGFLAIAVAILALALQMWRAGVRRYSGASS